MKFRPLFPFSSYSIGHVLQAVRCTLWHVHVCLLLHVSCWSILTKPPIFIGIIVPVYYSTIPYWPSRSNRPMFIGTLIPVYYSTFSYWSHRRIFLLVVHLTMLPGSLPKKYLNPPFPQPFLLFFFFLQPQSSTSLQISPDLLEPTHPQGISCSLNFRHPLLSPTVSTPNQRCALHCAPFGMFSR